MSLYNELMGMLMLDENFKVEILVENPVYELLDEAAKTDRKVNFKGPKNTFSILISRSTNTGGRSGQSSSHGPRIKIVKPKEFGKLLISIPTDEDFKKSNDPFIIEGKMPSPKYSKDMKYLKEFIKDYNNELINIFYATSDEDALKEYKKIAKDKRVEFKEEATTKGEEDELFSQKD